MTTLLYRGHDYIQHKDPAIKNCTDLVYRREHYNSCRDRANLELHASLSYRGNKYFK